MSHLPSLYIKYIYTCMCSLLSATLTKDEESYYLYFKNKTVLLMANFNQIKPWQTIHKKLYYMCFFFKGDQFENSSMVVRTMILASTVTGAMLIILSTTVVAVIIKRRFRRRVFTTENRYNIYYIWWFNHASSCFLLY